MIAAVIVTLLFLAASVWLTSKLREVDHHEVPEDVLSRIDDVLPREQVNQRWARLRDELKQ